MINIIFVLALALILKKGYEATGRDILPEHIALALGGIFTIFGVAMIFKLDPALLVLSAFILALLLPKFRAGVVLAIGGLRSRTDLGHSRQDFFEDTTAYGCHFENARLTGASDGTYGSAAGVELHD